MEALRQSLQDLKPQSLVLGFSGGADSMALALMLDELREAFGFELHLAHVDHKWRASSSREAKQLQAFAQQRGLSFYLHTLSPAELTGNLEAACREERLRFFKDLCEKCRADYLVLAHHRDDQVETVLKRLLEGRELFNFSAMQSVSQLEGMRIWRPLLSVPKAELLAFLESQKAFYIVDESNEDTQFWRARARLETLPLLEKLMGKSIGSSLLRLGAFSHELQDYIEERYAKAIDEAHFEGPLGACLEADKSWPSFVLRYAIRKIALAMKMELTCASLEKLQKAAESEKVLKEQVKGGWVFADRGRLFFEKEEKQASLKVSFSETGRYQEGDWELEVKEVEGEKRPSSWKDWYLGRAFVSIEPGNYEIVLGEELGSSLREYYSKQKTPSHLRDLSPVLKQKNSWVHEFLSGKSRKKGQKIQPRNQKLWYLELKRERAL